MANDKFFQRRKETSRDDTKRKQRTEKQKNRCLIVCEGITEVNYFQALYSSNTKRANNVKVDVSPSKNGTDPMSVVGYAIKQLKITSYDAVICVFDKERDAGNHEKFKQANEELERISKQHKKTTIIGAWSIPCFEVWSLCHVYYTTRPFTDKKAVEAELERQGFKAQDWRDDNKQKTAIINAKKLCDFHHDGNPSTRVHLAVEHLQSLLEA
ncbi:MAG: RloB family protein [Alphaproteobacteria bacterium]